MPILNTFVTFLKNMKTAVVANWPYQRKPEPLPEVNTVAYGYRFETVYAQEEEEDTDDSG